ncbi:MAG: tripartite tricarboxylate transporter substrate binding protein [Clostridia bacterium]|nr:tripartite tricarboxylate transporter substrate binding protein [Clostridia bacterium]
MKKLVSILLVLSMLLVGVTAFADAWKPTDTIVVDVAFAAGGDTDYNARAYVDRLSAILGVPVIANNVTGSNGAIASEEVKNAPANGYTVLFTQTSFVLNGLSGMTDYGIEAFKLACVAGGSSGWLIISAKDSGINTLEDLVKISNEKPLAFGGSTGASGSAIGEMLNQKGANLNVVDYGSATNKVAGVLSGDIAASVIPILTAWPYVQSGDFIPLGLTEYERNSCFPDVPTCIEQGYDVALPTYYFFAFPGDTPDEIVETFADACQQIYESEEYKNLLLNTYSQIPFFARGEEAYAILNSVAEKCEGLDF